jgi:hypothetical protein
MLAVLISEFRGHEYFGLQRSGWVRLGPAGYVPSDWEQLSGTRLGSAQHISHISIVFAIPLGVSDSVHKRISL